MVAATNARNISAATANCQLPVIVNTAKTWN